MAVSFIWSDAQEIDNPKSVVRKRKSQILRPIWDYVSLLHFDPEAHGIICGRHVGIYVDSFGLFPELQLLAIGQTYYRPHIVHVYTIDGERLAVPTEHESIDIAILLREADVPFDGIFVWTCAVDAFTVLLEPLADGAQNLLLVIGDGAIALGRDIQA